MRTNPTGWFIPDPVREDEPDPVESQRAECDGQLAAALPHIRSRGVVIQAGARCGLWPLMLARIFETVLAFEPDPANFECAQANCVGTPAVSVFEDALGRRRRHAYLAASDRSTGEHYIATPWASDHKLKRVPMTTIDDVVRDRLGVGVLGAVFLDIEGYEIEALEGARETLRDHAPLLVLEENECGRRYGASRGSIARWLKPHGYEQVGEYFKLAPEIQNDGYFHGSDLIFAGRR